MERLARLLPFRQFGRLCHLRKLVPCSLTGTSGGYTPSLFNFPEDEAGDTHASALPSALPSSLPAFCACFSELRPEHG